MGRSNLFEKISSPRQIGLKIGSNFWFSIELIEINCLSPKFLKKQKQFSVDFGRIRQKECRLIANAIAGYPYTTACSPKSIIFPGAEASDCFPINYTSLFFLHFSFM